MAQYAHGSQPVYYPNEAGGYQAYSSGGPPIYNPQDYAGSGQISTRPPRHATSYYSDRKADGADYGHGRRRRHRSSSFRGDRSRGRTGSRTGSRRVESESRADKLREKLRVSRSKQREVGATVVGGAAGGLIGHEIGKRTRLGHFGGVGGLLVGALLGNAAEHQIQQNKMYNSPEIRRKYRDAVDEDEGMADGRRRPSSRRRSSRRSSRHRSYGSDGDRY